MAIVATLICSFLFASYMDTHYTRTATITNISADGVITVVDDSGNEWEFYNYGFHVGDTVKMDMDTNHTEQCKDDIIIEVH